MSQSDSPKATCADCGKSYRVPDSDRSYRCKACGGEVSCAAPVEPADEPERPRERQGSRSNAPRSTRRRDTAELLEARAAADSARNLLAAFAVMFLIGPIVLGILMWKTAGAGYPVALNVWVVLLLSSLIYLGIAGLLLFAAYGARRRLTLGVLLAFAVQGGLVGFAIAGGWRPQGLGWTLPVMAVLTLLLVPIARRVDGLRKRYPDLRSDGDGGRGRRGDGRNAQGALIGFAACVLLTGAGFVRAFPALGPASVGTSTAFARESSGRLDAIDFDELLELLTVEEFEETFHTLWDDGQITTLGSLAAPPLRGEEELRRFLLDHGLRQLPGARTCLYELHGAGGPKKLMLDTVDGLVEVDLVVDEGFVAWTGIRMRT